MEQNVQISLIRTVMAFVIITRIVERGKGIAMGTEWVVSKSKDKVRGIVAGMDAVTSIGMVTEIKARLPLNLRNQTTKSDAWFAVRKNAYR